jgi:hypothetical protein
MKRFLTPALLACLVTSALAGTGWRYEETGRIKAPEARQGVAADAGFLYPVGNYYVGKYRKDTGEQVAHWECPEGDPLTHVNAGIVFNGELYGSHSNYPGVPHRSSVEVWDTANLEHKRSIDFGVTDGSLTWIDRRNGNLLACFVHYAKRGGVPGRGPEFTRLVEFDDHWKQVREWKLPADTIAALSSRGYSLSGGAIGPGGFLYVTGHDDQVLHVIKFPESGDQLTEIASIEIPAEGQAFAFDPVDPHILHMILKREREMITGRIHLPGKD